MPERPSRDSRGRSERAGSGRPPTPGSRPGRAMPVVRAGPKPRSPGRPALAPPPPLPAGVEPADLPTDVHRELREVPPAMREVLTTALAGAGALLDMDADAAYVQAAHARRLAPRLAAVREAAGITAYRTGRYAEALSDLRAFTRITGDVLHLPLIADCERGLGRPERALTLAHGADAERLGVAGRVELRIVAAGARRDLGEPAAALVELRCPELDSPEVTAYTGRLWYAYADSLHAVGRNAEAATWFAAVSGLDADGETDAAERLAALGGT